METKEQPFTVRGILNRAKGLMAPPETMTQKFARQDAERAAKAPAITPEVAEKPDVIDTIKARNKLMQGLADGGIVKQLRYLSGMPNDERTLEKSRPAPTMNNQTPVESKPITSKLTVDDLGRGLGFENVRRHKAKMESQGLKDGGAVKAGIIRGPGTGTSDSIKGTMPVGSFVMPKDSTDVMVSNGETNFTPEMVQKVGAVALMAMKDATHTPVAEQTPSFKNGGAVKRLANGPDEEQQKQMGYSQQMKAVANSFGDAASTFGGRVADGAKTLVSAPGYGISNMMDERAQQPAAPATPVARVAQTAVTSGVSPTGGITAPIAPTAPVQPAAAAPSNQVTRVGNSYTGAPNITGDISINGKRAVEQQFYPAAQALATPTSMPATEQGGMNYGDGSGRPALGFAANLARKNAETGASSIFNTASRQTARDQLKAMDAQELAGANNQSNQAVAKLSADTQRVGYGIQAQNNQAIQQNAAARLGIDRTTANLQNQQTTQQIGAAKQMQDLQTKLINSKTPEERAINEENYRAAQGKYEKAFAPRFTVVDGGVGTNGVKLAANVINNQTGEFVKQPKNLDIESDVSAEKIRDDKTMSLAQKRQALEKLGYQ